jgi:hypothetical protein
MPLKRPRRHIFYSHCFNSPKMANVQTSEVNTKHLPIKVEAWRVKVGKNGNQTFLRNSWTNTCSTICPTFGPLFNHSNNFINVTMETKVRSLLQLNNSIDTILLYYVREAEGLVISRTTYLNGNAPQSSHTLHGLPIDITSLSSDIHSPAYPPLVDIVQQFAGVQSDLQSY